jgi:hypothetical protein
MVNNMILDSSNKLEDQRIIKGQLQYLLFGFVLVKVKFQYTITRG